VILEVRVIPRAQKTEFSGERDGRMVVRLAAPPVDGAAREIAEHVVELRIAAPGLEHRVVPAGDGLVVELATDRGLTLCGWVRDGRVTVYTEPWRIV